MSRPSILFIYFSIYIYLYTYVHIYILFHLHLHIHLPTYFHTFPSTFTYICIHIHIHTFTYTLTYTFTYTNLHIHLHIQILFYKYIQGSPNCCRIQRDTKQKRQDFLFIELQGKRRKTQFFQQIHVFSRTTEFQKINGLFFYPFP